MIAKNLEKNDEKWLIWSLQNTKSYKKWLDNMGTTIGLKHTFRMIYLLFIAYVSVNTMQDCSGIKNSLFICIHKASLLFDLIKENSNIWQQWYEIGINYNAKEAQENLLLQLQKELIKEKEKHKQKNNRVI